MDIHDLDFTYPERLVATERAARSRVLLVDGGEPREITLEDLLSLFQPGDLLVINDTRVLPRRVFSGSGLEVLFLKSQASSDGDPETWEVLCPASRWKNGEKQLLPDGVTLELVARGKPQVVRPSRTLDTAYFDQFGDLPLPPYIQKARGERRNRAGDSSMYQTAWAERPGSLAAPTASLHFDKRALETLLARGVRVARITLHVGLGTFLPITVDRLEDHTMHFEAVEISAQTWQDVQACRARGGRVWALGTTVVRALESAALGKLAPHDGGFAGETDLFIQPGFEFQVVDHLCTNFHQPRSTLLALVASFAGLETVRRAYAWAIEREFRLFSYGDLSVWINR
ncbi:MAG: tRNA preQ1(34) S-adenosylmethionine ribosyltransferase-isomerase QueA [Bdellovibrionaceae bacterium]|nr:tRNA preQ1(34) S-adenosylmethionine ribosyltransferase-isomerase QueA [Pseudobdellovibrionaceae bacterium]